VIEPKWVLLATVRAIHEVQLARHGGSSGIRDEGLLESALARPQQIFHYEDQPSLTRLAGAYAFGIAKNHPFFDGNKRTAFVTAAVFLADNGWRLVAEQAEATVATLRLAGGEWTEHQYSAWLTENSVRRKS
jgi:death-on-curing protein